MIAGIMAVRTESSTAALVKELYSAGHLTGPVQPGAKDVPVSNQTAGRSRE